MIVVRQQKRFPEAIISFLIWQLSLISSHQQNNTRPCLILLLCRKAEDGVGGMGGRRGCALEGTRPPGPGDSRCLFSYFSHFFSPRCSTPSSCSPCPPPGQASTSTQYRDNPGHRVSNKKAVANCHTFVSDKNSIARLWNERIRKTMGQTTLSRVGATLEQALV